MQRKCEMRKEYDDKTYFIFANILKLHYQRLYVLLEKINLYPGQPHLLFILNKEDGLRQKDISKRLNVAPATLTMMIKRLEKEELVYREKDSLDKRVYRVYITESGRKTAEKAKKVFREIENNCFGSLTKEEKKQLNNLLLKVEKNLKDNL